MDLDVLLEATAAVDDLTPTAGSRARTILDETLAAATPLQPRRHRGAVRVGLAAAAAAAVIAAPIMLTDRGHGDHANAATAVLHKAGAAAGRQSGGWPNAAYWHSTSTYQRDGKTVRREIWLAHHQQLSVLRDPGVAPGLMSLGRSTMFNAGGTSLSWDQLYALPTNATQLKRVLTADIHGAGQNDNQELFVIVGDLLRESPAPPALRQALYSVAASVPGATAVGPVTDRDGRTGQGVRRDGETYIIDTSTGQLLQDGGAGFVATYEQQGPASTAPRPTSR